MYSPHEVDDAIISVDADLQLNPSHKLTCGSTETKKRDKNVDQSVSGGTKETRTPTHINSLPNEILSWILEVGVTLDDPAQEREFIDEGHNDDSDMDSLWEFATVVSHVCSRWRSCALAAPSLWTRIGSKGGLNYEKTTTWITRSKSTKLDIFLIFVSGWRETQDFRPQITKAMSILLPHLPRWRRVILHFGTYAVLSQVLKALEGNAAPELRVLSLDYMFDDCDYDAAMLPPTPFLGGPGSAPKLQSVTLKSTPISLSNFPWIPTNMLRLDLSLLHQELIPLGSQLIRILNSFTNLRQLGLGRIVPIWDLPKLATQDSILLPNLHSVSFSSFNSSRSLRRVIGCLKMPVLKHLTRENLYIIAGPSADFKTTLGLLRERIRSMAVKLEKLALINVYTSELEGLHGLFESCRTLKHIHICVRQINPNGSSFPPYLRLLEMREGGLSTICPNMETFAVTGFGGSVVVGVARDFHTAGRPLKKLWYSERDDIKPEDLKTLVNTVAHVFEIIESEEVVKEWYEETNEDWDEETEEGSD